MMSKVSVESYRTSCANHQCILRREEDIHMCTHVMTIVKSPSPSTHQPEGFMVHIAILFSFDLKLAEK